MAQPSGDRKKLRGPAGELEARIDLPAGGAGAGRAALVCHPHPLYGGTMDNKVVYTLARAFNDLGMPALRFNFRGVGESDGAFAGGDGEAADALAAWDWIDAEWGPRELCLAGFSFGAMVALRVAEERRPACLVTVAPPVRDLPAEYAGPGCPWVLVQGEADDVVEAPAVLEWAGRLAAPPRVETFAGVGHFFHGHLPQLRERVVAAVTEIMEKDEHG
ncbi:MAG TPA: CocE/NonD family hydrolase [Gammaproteobacteria bacterium]|nr:CocE/NonD family hydrolase [Gammaproteobacteria bacterium]